MAGTVWSAAVVDAVVAALVGVGDDAVADDETVDPNAFRGSPFFAAK